MHLLRCALLLLLYWSIEWLLRRHRTSWLLLGHRQRSTLHCYLLLLALFYCNLLRQRRMGEGGGGWLLERRQHREHLFVYNSFLFHPRNRAADSPEANSSITFVVLFLANQRQSIQERLGCVVQAETSGGGEQRRMRSRKERISSLDICALDVFVLTCTMNLNGANDFGGHLEKKYSLLVADQNRWGLRRASRIQLEPKVPEKRPRGLVLCISRVLAFERWQLLITALEAYRHMKVDLVVSHVQSALAAIFQLMLVYEREGRLSIRPGIRLPHTADMAWNPNAETEFNGQILLAHECFYEFRESADFVGLIDWDDLLIPSRHFDSLPAAFQAASQAHPDAAYFLVNKLESSFVQQTKSARRFSLQKLLNRGVRTAEMYNDEKMVVRPRRLRGFWMHHSRHLEPGWRPVQLLTNYSLLLHLANEERVPPEEFRLQLLAQFNHSQMDGHSRRVLAQLARRRMLDALPRSQPYFDAIAECHRLLFVYYKAVGPANTVCLSYSLCQLPRLKKPCILAKSHFRTRLTRGAANAVHVRTGSEFVESPGGCAQAHDEEATFGQL